MGEELQPMRGKIHLIRGLRVMLDVDLAEIYGVETRVFNQAIKRNQARFPLDFCFQLTASDKDVVITICDHLERLKFSPYLPHAFTEHGALMAASVLKSPQAVEMSVFVVRAFVHMRETLAAHVELSRKLDELERKVSTHDQAIAGVIDAMRQLMQPPDNASRPIGFTADINQKPRKK